MFSSDKHEALPDCCFCRRYGACIGRPVCEGRGQDVCEPRVRDRLLRQQLQRQQLDLHVGYKDGPFFIQAGPAMSNDTTSTDWGWSGKAGVSGQVDDQTNLYAEVGFSKFDGSDTGSYVKTGAVIDFWIGGPAAAAIHTAAWPG